MMPTASLSVNGVKVIGSKQGGRTPRAVAAPVRPRMAQCRFLFSFSIYSQGLRPVISPLDCGKLICALPPTLGQCESPSLCGHSCADHPWSFGLRELDRPESGFLALAPRGICGTAK